MDETYKDSLNGLVEHSLLHLYLHCAENSRFIPTAKRNQILVQHLKPKVKDPQYGCLKNEIKRFIAIGRKPKGDLEWKLIEIKKIHEDLDKEPSDARNLFDLLETLKIRLKIDSRFINENESKKPHLIYMYQSDIEKGFDNNGNQLKPLVMLVNQNKITSILEEVKQTGTFEVKTTDIEGELVLNSVY